MRSAFDLFCGCRKPDQPARSRTELITAAPWKFSQVGIDQNNDGIADIPLPSTFVSTCSTDNLYTFKADSTGILDEGPIICSSINPRVSPFTWYFLNNQTEINISANLLTIFTGPAKIVELSETRFSLAKDVGIHGYPSPLALVVTLVH
jgi:hypothetical protein